ncbi:MAG: lipid II flippase MurJ, partial [Nitrospinota bacterium]
GRPELRRCLVLMLPAAYGMAVTQVNLVVDRFLASFLSGGSVSYLYYGNRLVQFPLGVFGIAIAVAAFPTLSHQAVAEEREAFRETLLHAGRLTLFILLPATVGLVVLAEPIMDVLFRRGEFGPEATRGSAIALRYYAVGLVFFGGVKTLTSAFYSLQDTRTPVRYANRAVGANIVLNLLLMGPLKHGGLALATSLASALNFALLARALRARLGGLGARRAAVESWRLAVAALLMGGLLWAFMAWAFDPLAALPARAAVLGAGVVLGGGFYLLVCRALGCAELREVERAARKKMAAL